MTTIAFFVYTHADDNMLETCITSLRKAAPDCRIVLATDGISSDVRAYLQTLRTEIITVPAKQMCKRRATCKIEVFRDVVYDYCNPGDELLVSDVDVVFQSNPFHAFEEHPSMDVGLTTRGYSHLFPINAGEFCLRINTQTYAWTNWHLLQVHAPSWPPYVTLRQRYNHTRYGPDWTVGQDFLIANWLNKDIVRKIYDVRIEDIGCKYNYCPATDTMGAKARELIRAATENPDIVTIHLKSSLKDMIYDAQVFPKAVLRHPKGKLAWM